MPVLDGQAAMLRIRQALTERRQPHPVICAVTAKALPGDREQALADGMVRPLRGPWILRLTLRAQDAYVAKPIKLDELISILMAASAQKHAAAPPPLES